MATAIVAPGVIQQTGVHRRVVLGEAFGSRTAISSRAARVAATLAQADIEVGEGVEIVDAPETVIASIVIVKEAVLEPQVVEEGAEPAVEGEEAAPAAEQPEGEGGGEEG